MFSPRRFACHASILAIPFIVEATDSIRYKYYRIIVSTQLKTSSIPNYAWIISFKEDDSLIEYFNTLRGADFNAAYKFVRNKNRSSILSPFFLPAEKNQKTNSTATGGLAFSPRCNAPWKRQFRAKRCLVSCNPPDSRHAEPSRTQASPNIAPFHPWNRAEESSLSLSLGRNCLRQRRCTRV